MRIQVIAGLLIATVCSAQTPVAAPPASLPAQQLTVPTGTVIPLTLDRAIMRKSKIGDVVNATVAFPVTIGNQFAIPAGADVQGVITALKAKQPSVAIHFTRLTYPNGYIVSFDAVNSAALIIPAAPATDTYADASFGQPRVFGPNPAADPSPQQQQPVLMNPTGRLTPGEKVAIFVGGIGTFVALVGLLIYSSVKHAQSPILFDAGWQFQMTLQTPLALDTSKIAISTSIAH